MELAISIIALGGLFVISNQKNKETFKLQKDSHLKQSVNEYKTQPRENKHFVPPQKQSNMEYKDLAGRIMKIDEQTVNMVPFFGKTKNIGNNSKSNDERDSTLDNYTGAGSMQITKTENAPLFKPQDNIQHAYGAPNQTAFFQSRENPSTNMHNIKPFQEQRVAPGLNHGFESQGSGGFNAGMEARSQWLPKTVDELRVASKPKESFELANHQGPAINNVTNMGSIGKVEKYLPDKYFVNTPDRYFTTTGSEQGPTLRSIQPAPTIHRATTTKSYAGVAGNAAGAEKQPQHGMYRLDHRQQLQSEHFNPASTTVERSNLNAVSQSIELLPNNRTTTKPESFSIMKGLVNAITAPITDILRPTRKENFGLSRVGALGSSIPQNTLPQNDKVSSTIKESTTYSPYTKGQRAYKPVTVGGYQVTSEQPIANQRDTTSVFYSGAAGSTMPQQISYGAEYNSTINSSRGNEGRIAGGNTQRFTPIINQTTNLTKSSNHTSYTGMPNSIISSVPQAPYENTRTPQSYDNTDRFNPTLLEVLKQNPYNHSITNNM